MMSRRPGDLNNLLPSGAEFIVLLAVVVPIYLAVKFWYVLLPIVGFLLILWGIMYIVEISKEGSTEEARKKAAIIERAESQHTRLMDGDESALYGDYPPANLYN